MKMEWKIIANPFRHYKKARERPENDSSIQIALEYRH